MVSKSPRHMIYLFPPFSLCLDELRKSMLLGKRKPPNGGNNYFNKINFVLTKKSPLFLTS